MLKDKSLSTQTMEKPSYYLHAIFCGIAKRGENIWDLYFKKGKMKKKQILLFLTVI